MAINGNHCNLVYHLHCALEIVYEWLEVFGQIHIVAVNYLSRVIGLSSHTYRVWEFQPFSSLPVLSLNILKLFIMCEFFVFLLSQFLLFNDPAIFFKLLTVHREKAVELFISE